MSNSTDRGSGDPHTDRVGVYGRSEGPDVGKTPPESVEIYDRPRSAGRQGVSPAIIAIGAAVVIGVPLLIWAL